ncbi:hypothetical protein [Vampirovibrio sp.]|uniref:hypothetical protein n=1 Tax=Vampirovibrio sp. TaxID=2717857 RepID=UPI003593A13A
MLNLINAYGLIYAAALYGAFLCMQSIAENNRVQYAVIRCKARFNARANLY